MIEAKVHGSDHLGRRLCAGADRDVLLKAVLHDSRIESGRNDELRAGCCSTVNLINGQDGSCSDKKIRILLCHDADRLLCGVGAEGNLCCRKTALYEALSKRLCILYIVQNNNRNDSDLFKFLKYGFCLS